MNKTVKQGTDKARDDRLTKEETTMTDDGWRREEEEERKQKAGEREREREREKKKKKKEENKRGTKVVAQVADMQRGRQ